MLRATLARGRNTRSLAIAGATKLAACGAQRIVVAQWLEMTLADCYDDVG